MVAARFCSGNVEVSGVLLWVVVAGWGLGFFDAGFCGCWFRVGWVWICGFLVSGWVGFGWIVWCFGFGLTVVRGGDCWISQRSFPLAWEYWWGWLLWRQLQRRRRLWRRHKSREVGI